MRRLLFKMRNLYSAFFLLFGGMVSLAGGVTLYPMDGGNLRRENHALSPSSITMPLKLKWSAPTSPITSGDYTTPAGGPIVLTDRVIQCFMNVVLCTDRGTGVRLWQWSSPDAKIYYTPTYDPDRNVVYVCRMDGSTYCLSPQTGNVLWHYQESPTSAMFCSPVYAEGKIFTGNGSAGLVCVDPDTHQAVWHFNFSDYFGYSFQDPIEAPAYDNGYLYFTTRTGHFFCLKSSDGTCVWHAFTSCWRQNGLLLSDDYVYALNNKVDLECRKRSDGSLVWKTNIAEGAIEPSDSNLAICG
ncbi:MAG TPA: PQQ-binding-like beta-propeller repeat protein, partial [bacterium]|nr:PQQ-binding-like beta-propeller repeat protein [bacterium]